VEFHFPEPTDLGSNSLMQLMDADFKYPGAHAAGPPFAALQNCRAAFCRRSTAPGRLLLLLGDAGPPFALLTIQRGWVVLGQQQQRMGSPGRQRAAQLSAHVHKWLLFQDSVPTGDGWVTSCMFTPMPLPKSAKLRIFRTANPQAATTLA
jgi:hypothetical protein